MPQRVFILAAETILLRVLAQPTPASLSIQMTRSCMGRGVSLNSFQPAQINARSPSSAHAALIIATKRLGPRPSPNAVAPLETCGSQRPVTGLARSLAILAATPAVDGVVLVEDALIDLGSPLWEGPPFTAVLLGRSDIPDLELNAPLDPVRFLSATPITATEAAWVRLKGAEAMRQAWQSDGVDVLDPNRRAAQPN